MYSDEMSSFLSSLPMSPFLGHGHEETELSQDTGYFLYDEAEHGISDIEPINTESSQQSSSTIPFNIQDDYIVSSLDDMEHGYNEPLQIDQLNDSLPDSTSSETGTENTVEKTSVTSRLKSILMSRKVAQNNSTDLETNSSVSSFHTYSLPRRKCNEGEIKGQDERCYDRCMQHNTLRFPPCAICCGTASGLHYGVNSCEPCKGFFTRYLRKKEEYKCSKSNKCVITNRLRGNCSACRLKKCLALGMSRKNSRLGRYTLSRRMETIMQVNELEKQRVETLDERTLPADEQTFPIIDTSSNTRTQSNTQKPFSKFTLKAPSGFTHKLVKVLVEYMENIKPYGEDLVTDQQIMTKLLAHYESYKLKISVFGNLKSIPKDEYYNLLKVYGIEIDKRMTFLKQSADEMIDIIGRYCNFAKQIPNFKHLSCRDQQNLLKSSRYDFFMILMHSGYLHEKRVFLAHNGAAFHMEEVADKFFSRELVINVCDMYHRLQKLQLSKEEKALLIAISLVFTDRCSLEDPALVQKIQFSLTHLLQKQLEKTCQSSAFRRFTKIIDCLTIMRDSSEMFLKEYSQLCKDEMIIEEVPIMTELLFED